MELTLTRQSDHQISVICDGQFSHSFDLTTLVQGKEKSIPQLVYDPVAYGKVVFQALFAPQTAARRAFEAMPERLLLVTTDDAIDSVPWEYAHGPEGFLVLEFPFVRGLPANQRIDSPKLEDGLHIVAVPSNPLSREIEPLNIDAEWMRLKEIIQELPYSITLERARPPTLERVGLLVANQRNRIVHFMGHGGQGVEGAILCFEQDNGRLAEVTAKQFMQRVRGTVFLVTLNACVSATPGEMPFSNLAAALVQQKIPYALGMRLSIVDEDARSFSRTFYSYLARGISVEKALFQARQTLANSPRQWVIGVPVLYTALAAPAPGFACLTGTPTVDEYQPRIEASVLHRAEGAFQGRIDALQILGEALTGDSRPVLLSIRGGGGLGKTALAREAVERFAYAWPGGVWATSLEGLPSREVFVAALARFLGIAIQEVTEPDEPERGVLARLSQQRLLIVLDNAETLVEAVEASNEEAVRLARFLREQLPRPPVSLLVTSRSILGWTGEIGYELGGLAPAEGSKLFQQQVPQRLEEIDRQGAMDLSKKIEGHPLSLRLLGSAFNASALSFSTFVEQYEAYLLHAEDKYKEVDHRQRTLYASVETSVRYLSDDLRSLLSGLWIFHAPFLPETAVAIFDPEHKEGEGKRSPVYQQLQVLWRRGLLTFDMTTLLRGTMFYHLRSTMRPYIEHYLQHIDERGQLLVRFGNEYARLVRFLYKQMDSREMAALIAFQCREDFERAASYVIGVEQGYYLLCWGWALHRLGDRQRGLELLEQALEIGQEQDQRLEMLALEIVGGVNTDIGQPHRALESYEKVLLLIRKAKERAGEAVTLHDMALVYRRRGQLRQALKLDKQALHIRRKIGDRAGVARTLNNMAEVYRAMGQSQRALKLHEQALPLTREVGDRDAEATVLSNMALVYQETGHLQRALELYEQALPLMREVGDRAGEAVTLHNIADVHVAMQQPQRGLELYEQALRIRREVGDHAGEATTLGNMALVHQATGQLQQALELYEQVLPLIREMGDCTGETRTLTNMAVVCYQAGQLQQALELYEQALPLIREMSDRAGEAGIFHNMAVVCYKRGQLDRALKLCEQALPLIRGVGDRAWKVAALTNMAIVYYIYGLPPQVLELMEQAIAILAKSGLPHDAAGHTVDALRQTLNAMFLLGIASEDLDAFLLQMPEGSALSRSIER